MELVGAMVDAAVEVLGFGQEIGSVYYATISMLVTPISTIHPLHTKILY